MYVPLMHQDESTNQKPTFVSSSFSKLGSRALIRAQPEELSYEYHQFAELLENAHEVR
jgi:hypothetical protein